ncbi:hypothetical protein BG257_05005 [Proteus mirabilis]|nr:hypothetical protein BG257_05005 [Proteus mirabilis]ATC77311.1 hypothetical protein BG029_02110 [Proteus mirabilis]MVD50530.1 glycosyltransferase family 2 protein [Proteus mirabilis]MVF41456.1 glycosyltransferase family 2 protein [Proteus mirabilis]QKQ94170.1 glycosyltransferase [Proteus mirabilis]
MYKISIIMPAFNSDSVIKESIESVLGQTHTNFELIICDDLSTDNTKEIIKKYVEIDQRIKLVNNIFKKGAAGARNSCIQASTSRYICFLDSDDLWAPEKLEKQINFMKKHKIAMTHSDYVMFDAKNNKKTIQSPKVISFSNIIKKCDIGCLTVMLDKKLIPYDISFPYTPKEDYALWVYLMKNGIKSYNFGECSSFYRKQEQSLSSSKFKEIQKQWFVLKHIAQLNFINRVKCISLYSINGFKKHFL